jgi:hypothetical protein
MRSQGRTEALVNWYSSKTAATDTPPLAPVQQDGSVRFAQPLLQQPNPSFVAALLAACQNGTIITPMDALNEAMYLLLLQLPQYANAIPV